MAKVIEFHPEVIKEKRAERKAEREARKAERGEKKLGIGAKIAIAGSCVAVGAGATLAAIKLCTKNPDAVMMEYPVEVAGAEIPVPEMIEVTNVEGEV